MITLVYDEPEGDWAAVYRDGRLVSQGHRISARDVLQALGEEYAEVWDADAGKTGDQFPPLLADVERVGN